MTTWMRAHFADADHAMTTIAIVGLAIGALGFSLVMLGVYLSR